MKTTIIDLLNKIANGEEPPKKIYYLEETFTYDEKSKDYYDSENYGLFDSYVIPDILNDEVIILETTITYKQDNYYQYQPYTGTGEVEIKCNSPKNLLESNKIEKIDIYDSYTSHNNLHTYINTYDKDGKIKRFAISAPQRKIIMKINEIIDRVNE